MFGLEIWEAKKSFFISNVMVGCNDMVYVGYNETESLYYIFNCKREFVGTFDGKQKDKAVEDIFIAPKEQPKE